MEEQCTSAVSSCSTVELQTRGESKAKEAKVGVSMRTETVSAAALGSAGFRYLYSVCFFRLFGPTGL